MRILIIGASGTFGQINLVLIGQHYLNPCSFERQKQLHYCTNSASDGGYSVRNDLTGLALAALIAWKPTVSSWKTRACTRN